MYAYKSKATMLKESAVPLKLGHYMQPCCSSTSVQLCAYQAGLRYELKNYSNTLTYYLLPNYRSKSILVVVYNI